MPDEWRRWYLGQIRIDIAGGSASQQPMPSSRSRLQKQRDIPDVQVQAAEALWSAYVASGIYAPFAPANDYCLLADMCWRFVRWTAPGTRNDCLFVEAATAGEYLDLDDKSVAEALLDAALKVGLGEDEAKATILSGLKKGRANRQNATRSGKHSSANTNATTETFERGDHVELARKLVASLQAAAPVVYADGDIWQYDPNECIYRIMPGSALSQAVQGYAGATVGSGKKAYALRLRASDVSGSITLAQARIEDTSFFANAPKGIVFQNGFVEVTDGGILVHGQGPENRARFAYPFAFDANASPTKFLEFLHQVFRDDADVEDKIKLMQEYVGTAILGLCTRYQQTMVQVGDGANGKGVLSQVVLAAMPPGSTCAIAPQDFGQEYRRAMLAGKLLNVVSELPEADILDSEAFKAIVAGDLITARAIRQAPFQFAPVAGHLFSANRLPGTVDQTHGFWRRFILVPFNRVFGADEQDPELATTLIHDELGAIVGWCLDGAQRVMRERHYTIPRSHQRALEVWRKAADQVKGFLEDECTVLPLASNPAMWTKASIVYDYYRTWASSNGHRPLASNSFGDRMARLGLPSKHTTQGNVYPVTI